MTGPDAAHDTPSTTLAVVVDHRERRGGLVDALRPLWSTLAIGNLPVGDVQIGPRVLVERKTVHDLVRSVADGRLYRQLYALCGETFRPLLLIEGFDALPAAGLGAESLRGVLLSAAVGYRVPMLRTHDVHESAVYLAAIAAREQRRLERGGQRRRERAGPLAVLAAVPGVGDERAAALLAEFGSLARVFTADASELTRVSSVGPATARRLSGLGAAPAPDPPHEVAARPGSRDRKANPPSKATGRDPGHGRSDPSVPGTTTDPTRPAAG